MHAIRTIQSVTGPTLTIAVPEFLQGKQVEVTIQPVLPVEGPLPPELDPRYAPFIRPKPPLSDEMKKEFEKNPYPLRGSVTEYIDPFEPAVPPDDWDVYREDARIDPD